MIEMTSLLYRFRIQLSTIVCSTMRSSAYVMSTDYPMMFTLQHVPLVFAHCIRHTDPQLPQGEADPARPSRPPNHVLRSGFGLRQSSSCPQQLPLFRYVATNVDPPCTISHSSNHPSKNRLRLSPKVPVQQINDFVSDKDNERHQADL